VIHPSCGLQEEKIMMCEEKAKAKTKHLSKREKKSDWRSLWKWMPSTFDLGD
jgi:hypothetical protein